MTPHIDIQAYGAQIREIEPWPIFYLSPEGLKSDRCVRGGQPVLFPQFAESGPLRKHGFVRDLPWKICENTHIEATHRVVCATEITAVDFPEWPYEVTLILSIEARPGQISQKLNIKNTGNATFSWTGGLHPYFLIGNYREASLDGLEGVRYFDRYAPGVQYVQAGTVVWNEAPCEKLFDRAPGLKLWTGTNCLTLQTEGFDQWMVWNPGLEGAKSITDLPNEDWNKFVCIEPVCVDRPVQLKPGEVFKGSFEIGFDAERFKFDAFSKTD